MFVNIIKTYRDVVAICDSELIGKKFEEGNFELDIKESFFKGEETSEEKLRDILNDLCKEDATFNIVGEESIKIALEEGIIHEEAIKRIQGVPFALVLL